MRTAAGITRPEPGQRTVCLDVAFMERVPKDDTSLAEEARPENERCEKQFKRYGRR
jgi:hypothetical protein